MAFSHIMLGAKDKAKSAAFYDAVLPIIGYTKAFDMEARCAYTGGEGQPLFMVGKPYEGDASFGNGTMIGFVADTRAKVRDAHAAGLKAGGKDDGAPGHRTAGPPNNYGAYLRDPSGNKISIFCMKPGE